MNEHYIITSKDYLISWWILALISLFLWYRNVKYDRIFSIYTFTIGLIQLIEYGVYNGANSGQSGNYVYIILWLQCLILAICTFIYFQDIFNQNLDYYHNNLLLICSGWNIFLFAIIFIVSLITVYLNKEPKYHIFLDEKTGNMIWKNDKNESILGSFWWLYICGLFIPLFLLLFYTNFTDSGLFILILTGLLSICYIMIYYPADLLLSKWSYFSIIFVFICWIINLS